MCGRFYSFSTPCDIAKLFPNLTPGQVCEVADGIVRTFKPIALMEVVAMTGTSETNRPQTRT